MPHHIYTTPGFLVHSTPHGEAGRFLLVFTRELGMVGAIVAGVRLLQSKLRYHTKDYSYGLFSLVRGKDIWRVTGVKDIDGLKDIHRHNLRLYVQVLSLIRRLVPGEEKNEKLFDLLEKLYQYLAINILDDETKMLVEYITVWRMLCILGYVENKFGNVYIGDELDSSILSIAKEQKTILLAEINYGLKQSQL